MATRPNRERKKIFFRLIGHPGSGADRDAGTARFPGGECPAGEVAAPQSALMRVAKRDNLRATVFLCSTPFVVARCSSGWAS